MRFVPNAMSRQVGRAALKTRAKSPQIMFAAGVVGVVATTVMASKATLKLDRLVNDIEDTKQKISDLEGSSLADGKEYTAEDAKKDRIVVTTQGAIKIAKLYAPTVIIGTLTIGCFTGAHVTLSRRNVALTAAYAGLQEAYNGYRDRVREKYGEQTELEMYHGTVQKEVVTNDVNGPKKTTITTIDGTRSPYARFFDEVSPQWNPQPEYNLIFLRMQQQWANDMLKARGHVFLNEVYDHLGLERTKAGAVVGWVMGNGDNYIDFGMYDDRPAVREFVNGREASILLDFNVDGVILDQI